MQLIIQDQTIVFNVEYAKRKKFYLHVTPEGHITVKAPSKSTEEEIKTFVASHSKDILASEKRRSERKVITRDKSYTEEEHFLYLGKACTLSQLLEVIPDTEEQIQVELKKFYTKQTKDYIKQSVKRFEKIIGVKSKSVTIVDSPRTWGTCNNYKELTFNYKLSMAPPAVMDYVVIHELCHLLHLNHDRSFWRKVGAYDPNYTKHEAYLARVGGVMTI